MSTAARTYTEGASHWYYPDGRTCYELPKVDGKGTKSPTLADARKLNLIPGVSTILSILDKPALNSWKIEQAVLACMSTPRLEGEAIDAFVTRVLKTERVQEQEVDIARDRGIDIHTALEKLARGEEISNAMAPWVIPAWEAVRSYGTVYQTERVLIGPGYGGRADLILKQSEGYHRIVDWKSSRKLPKEAYPEARLQLSAYCKALYDEIGGVVDNANVYISTVNCGEFVVCVNPDYYDTYTHGFAHLTKLWQHMRGYVPQQ